MTFELRELESWFSTYPQPQLEAASRAVLKADVREALGATHDHEAPGELKLRLKAAVRRELAAQESGAAAIPIFSLRRPAPWLFSAAALVFVVLGFGLWSKNAQPITDDTPIVIVLPTGGEWASIESELAYLEVQSLASDFVFFGSGDDDSDLRDDIERTFLHRLYLESSEDPYQEGVSQ